jgi:Protein of unknown function (DUF1579)
MESCARLDHENSDGVCDRDDEVTMTTVDGEPCTCDGVKYRRCGCLWKLAEPIGVEPMRASTQLRTGLCFGIATLMAGCQEPDMAEMMAKQKARPSEMDMLSPMLGEWTSTSESKMMGMDEVMKGTGSGEYHWGVNDRYLMGTMKIDMGGMMGSLTGTEYWTYDSSIKKFRTWWFDDMGTAGTGTAWYDDASRTWKMRGKGYDTVGGRHTTYNGWMRFKNNVTLDWEWSEYGALGLVKFHEVSGTSRRK